MSGRRRLAGARSLALVVFAALSAAGCFAQARAETVFTPISLPTISGNTVEGEVLSETPARWSSQPVSHTLQWQRCDAKGKGCQSISKANGPTYQLTSADVGSTIRISENARDAAGAVTPVDSEPTAVVQAPQSGSHGGGEQGGGGGGSQPSSPGHPSSAELERLLLRELVPSGRAASLAALRRHGGLSMRFTLPAAGTLTVMWYLATPAGRAKRGPMLVASARATLSAGRATTVKLRLTTGGKRLLGRSRKLRLRAQAAFAVSGGATVRAAKKFSLR